MRRTGGMWCNIKFEGNVNGNKGDGTFIGWSFYLKYKVAVTEFTHTRINILFEAYCLLIYMTVTSKINKLMS